MSASTLAQKSGHSQEAEILIAGAKKKLEQKKNLEGKMLAIEAYEAALASGDGNQKTEAALLIMTILQEQNNFSEAFNYGIVAVHSSQDAVEEYKLVCLISVIQLLDKWNHEEKSLEYIKAAEPLVKHNAELQLLLLKSKIAAYRNSQQNEEAVAAAKELLEKAKQSQDHTLMCESLELLSSLEMSNKKPENALQYELELYNRLTWNSALVESSISANNLGQIYFKLNELESSSYFFNEAVTKCPNDFAQFDEIMFNQAGLFIRNRQLENATTNLDFILKKRAKVEDELYCKSLTAKASVLNQNGLTAEAITLGMEALEIAHNKKYINLEPDIHEMLSLSYTISGEKQKSREHSVDAQKLRSNLVDINKKKDEERKKTLIQLEKDEKMILSNLAADKQKRLEILQYKLSAENKEKDIAIIRYDKELKDAEYARELAAREKAQASLKLLQAALNGEQQEKSIIELERQKQSQLLSLTQLELDKKNKDNIMGMLQKHNELLESESKLKEEQSRRDAITKQYAIITGILMLLGMAAISYGFFVSRKKNKIIASQNSSIEVQNDQLREINTDITKSIASASHFQKSLVPGEAMLSEYLEDGFIFYKPLDIVSGDLPFVIKIGKYTWIAAIDCIGHGVPAAMLSFSAYYNLKEILSNTSMNDPGVILEVMNENMINTLRSGQSNNEFSSGLDISLVKIDKFKKQIQFAGAQSPLIIMNNTEIRQLKGDRYSVADLSNETIPAFNTSTIDIIEGDKFFLMSDGIIHQMKSGTDTKLYSMKKLMKLLFDNQRKNFRELKEIIEKDHNDWKGDADQTDDMLCIGFQVL
jgi:Stage II sporulation protein E (SpoIIE)